MISLIICTRNRSDLIGNTLDSILAGSLLPSELIIVDQSNEKNSQLSTLKLDSVELIYHWSEKKGLSLGNNLGAKLASHNLLIFTHDDVRVTENWLEVLVQALTENGPKAIVTGRILAEPNRSENSYTPSLRIGKEPEKYSGRIDIDVLKPLNMGFYRTALEDVGWFDEALGPGTVFPGAEDSDLGYRFLTAGYTIIYVPKAVIYHLAWRSKSDYLRIRWDYGFSQGAFLAKHFRLTDWFMAKRFLLDLQRRAIRFVRRIWRDPLIALGDPIFICGNLIGGSVWWWLKLRRKI